MNVCLCVLKDGTADGGDSDDTDSSDDGERDEHYDDINKICGSFAQKNCESGFCVWENNKCIADECVFTDFPCAGKCEEVHIMYDLGACRRKGAYMDYCYLGYMYNNTEDDMTRCLANSSCDIDATPEYTEVMSGEDYNNFFGSTKLCVSKDRGAGSHTAGSYNYDVMCGFFDEKYCSGLPWCVLEGNKCGFDNCLFFEYDQNADCPPGCSRQTFSGYDVCIKTNKVVDTCLLQYYSFDGRSVNVDIDNCKLNTSCTVIDLPNTISKPPTTYVEYLTEQICVLKDGTDDGDDSDTDDTNNSGSYIPMKNLFLTILLFLISTLFI